MQISAADDLDAYWVAGVAKVRLLGIASFLDIAFDFAVAVNDVPGTYSCPGGGNLTYATSGARSMTFHDCNLGASLPVIVRSGTFSTPDAVLQSYAGDTLLKSAHFTLGALVYATTDTASLGYGADETANGSFFFQRQDSDLSVQASGAIDITRNGRVDHYSAIQIATTPGFDTGGDVDINAATLTIATPRFSAAASLAVTGDPTTLTVVAPDGSQVAGSEVAGPGVHYVVRPSASGSASVDTTLPNSDAGVTAAITRVLQ